MEKHSIKKNFEGRSRGRARERKEIPRAFCAPPVGPRCAPERRPSRPLSIHPYKSLYLFVKSIEKWRLGSRPEQSHQSISGKKSFRENSNSPTGNPFELWALCTSLVSIVFDRAALHYGERASLPPGDRVQGPLGRKSRQAQGQKCESCLALCSSGLPPILFLSLYYYYSEYSPSWVDRRSVAACWYIRAKTFNSSFSQRGNSLKKVPTKLGNSTRRILKSNNHFFKLKTHSLLYF